MKSSYLFYFFLLSLITISSCVEQSDGDPAPDVIGVNNITLTINEDAAVGSTVGEITLTNAASLSFTTSITAGNEDGIFKLTNTTLTLEKSLDFETTEKHVLTIEAKTNGQTVSGKVTIDVSDVEDNSNLTFEGVDYNLVDGFAFDYGSTAYFTEDEMHTHYNYDFALIDQLSTLDDESETGLSNPDVELIAYIELFSAGTASFQSGTFQYVNEDDITQEDQTAILGKNFFTYAFFEFASNSESEYQIVGGTVKVTDNGSNNYTLEFDVSVQEYIFATETFNPSSNESLSFTYTGDFQYVDETDEE